MRGYCTGAEGSATPPAQEPAGELLTALLGHGTDLESLKQMLITSTEGNPFFLEESVRTLVETRAPPIT